MTELEEKQADCPYCHSDESTSDILRTIKTLSNLRYENQVS